MRKMISRMFIAEISSDCHAASEGELARSRVCFLKSKVEVENMTSCPRDLDGPGKTCAVEGIKTR